MNPSKTHVNPSINPMHPSMNPKTPADARHAAPMHYIHQPRYSYAPYESSVVGHNTPMNPMNPSTTPMNPMNPSSTPVHPVNPSSTPMNPSGTLHRDLRRYNDVESKEEAAEESGWKLVHGDVFRPPDRAGLLAVYLGSGVQVLGAITQTRTRTPTPSRTVTLILRAALGC